MNGLFTDCYEFTMGNSLFLEKKQNKRAVFDMFFREIPEKGGYAIFAGLQAVIEYINKLKFTEEEINFLKKEFNFCDEYLSALKNLNFECALASVVEGTPIFPNEPIMRVSGPIWQCMLIEVALLNAVSHQSLVATKASRIVKAADGKDVIEFGARRAQGETATIWGARAAHIGGCIGVSVVEAGAKFDIPVSGTMAHSYIQSFGNDYDAFSAYAKAYPDNCVFLLDTYNTLKSGLSSAIKVSKEKNIMLNAVRIDSGDLGYLSKKIREELDNNDMQETKIIASNSLDEYKIRDLIADQNAPIDIFGVGENLITGGAEPVFSTIYKLSEFDGKPCMKFSDNQTKTTIPGEKEVYRLYDNKTDKAIADVVCLVGEEITAPYILFSPEDPIKRKTVSSFTAKKLLQPIYETGKQIYKLPKIKEIREYCNAQKETLWQELKRFNYPHKYYVDLSQDLYDLREELREKWSG